MLVYQRLPQYFDLVILRSISAATEGGNWKRGPKRHGGAALDATSSCNVGPSSHG